jgi:predicted nuclease of predicted toxin-antitoxin system
VRILANENVPAQVVAALREDSHDVAWVRTETPGQSDSRILQHASEEGRVLLTLDKDFGELAFRFGLPAASGIILLRARTAGPQSLAHLVRAALKARDDWAGHFSVIEADRIRMTPLPKQA